MPTQKGRIYRLYNCFRNELEESSTESEVLDVFARLLPAINAETAAILAQPKAHRQSLAITAQTGKNSLWSDYLSLYQSNPETLIHLLRLCTHPVAFSEIEHHARLRNRLQSLRVLLEKKGYNEALAIPLFDQQAQYSAMIIAGRDLTLQPSRRHWIIQAATDVAASIASIRQTIMLRHASPQEWPHYNLTPRQMEVAPWLVAGKSDWEIGKILKISGKTVNFHVENMKRTYGVKTRNQFVAAFVRRGGFKPRSEPPLEAHKANLSST